MMSEKTDAEVIIGGKVITISGNESVEYMQKVASYINDKLNECQKTDSFKKRDRDTQTLIIQLNMADDYFRVKNQVELLEQEMNAKENEIYDIKHELIATQIKLDNTTKTLKELQEEADRKSDELARVETELKELKKENK